MSGAGGLSIRRGRGGAGDQAWWDFRPLPEGCPALPCQGPSGDRPVLLSPGYKAVLSYLGAQGSRPLSPGDIRTVFTVLTHQTLLAAVTRAFESPPRPSRTGEGILHPLTPIAQPALDAEMAALN